MEQIEEMDINTILSNGFKKRLFETADMLNKGARLIRKLSKLMKNNAVMEKRIVKKEKELESLQAKVNIVLYRLDLKYGEAKSYEEWKAAQHK